MPETYKKIDKDIIKITKSYTYQMTRQELEEKKRKFEDTRNTNQEEMDKIDNILKVLD